MRLWLYGALTLLFMALGARADTLLIVVRTEDVSIIAADSKVKSSDETHTEPACKIHIAKEFVWATAGITTDVRSGFSILKLAKNAIDSGGSLDDVVASFELRAIPPLKGLLARLKRTNPAVYEEAVQQGHPVTAVFIQRTEVRVKEFAVPNIDIPLEIKVTNFTCPGAACPNGTLVLLAGYNKRANAELNQEPTFWSRRGVVGGLNYLMDRTIEESPDAVGGPVAILKIDRGGSRQWLQKGLCDE